MDTFLIFCETSIELLFGYSFDLYHKWTALRNDDAKPDAFPPLSGAYCITCGCG